MREDSQKQLNFAGKNSCRFLLTKLEKFLWKRKVIQQLQKENKAAKKKKRGERLLSDNVCIIERENVFFLEREKGS